MTTPLTSGRNSLVETVRSSLFSAVIGDVLDLAGHRRQFLPPGIHALGHEGPLVGRAMTVLEADLEPGQADATGHRPFGKMIEALDDLRPGEVYVCTGAVGEFALFGGLMARRAVHLGATGAILDGFCRDSRELAEIGLPIFCRGRYAQDQGVRGHVIDHRVPITFANGARIDPGDIVFGDDDGVVVIPQACEREVVAAALAKIHAEQIVRTDLLNGVSAGAVFEKHGIL